MLNKKTIRDISVSSKKVLVRCDFNVPLDDDGNITDNRRIVGALPTIKYLLEKNEDVVVIDTTESRELNTYFFNRFHNFFIYFN